jgi:hypothetical protein
MKNKIYRFIFCGLICFYNNFANAQNYDLLSQEVKKQWDSNKINGLQSWNGIETKYVLEVQGLDSIEANVLLERAQIIEEISNVNIENLRVIIICKGGTPFDSVKKIFSSLIDNLTIVEEIYFISKLG